MICGHFETQGQSKPLGSRARPWARPSARPGPDLRPGPRKDPGPLYGFSPSLGRYRAILSRSRVNEQVSLDNDRLHRSGSHGRNASDGFYFYT